jgi:hypothetical protein
MFFINCLGWLVYYYSIRMIKHQKMWNPTPPCRRLSLGSNPRPVKFPKFTQGFLLVKLLCFVHLLYWLIGADIIGEITEITVKKTSMNCYITCNFFLS